MPNERILFVPVSGEYGMGEYVRSLTLARELAARRPGAQIHFLLSAQARYADDVGFENTRLPASPTLHTAQVAALIRRLRPGLVVFDNAGRSAQLAAAKRAGAKLLYISARPRQRRKAFRWRWLRMLDEHWIAYPEFIAGSLTRLERCKLALMRGPRVRFLDVILPSAAGAAAPPGPYILLVPGGGTGHPGGADALRAFEQSAAALACAAMPAILVAPSSGARQDAANVRRLERLPLRDLSELMRHAELVVTNGGNTLLQAIACGAACVGVPIAKDQARRIERCRRAGIAVPAAAAGADIERVSRALLEDAHARLRLQGCARARALGGGLETAMQGFQALLETPR